MNKTETKVRKTSIIKRIEEAENKLKIIGTTISKDLGFTSIAEIEIERIFDELKKDLKPYNLEITLCIKD